MSCQGKKEADMWDVQQCASLFVWAKRKKKSPAEHQTSGLHILDYRNHTHITKNDINILWTSKINMFFLFLFGCNMNAQILNYLICNGAIIHRDFFFFVLLTCWSHSLFLVLFVCECDAMGLCLACVCLLFALCYFRKCAKTHTHKIFYIKLQMIPRVFTRGT